MKRAEIMSQLVRENPGVRSVEIMLRQAERQGRSRADRTNIGDPNDASIDVLTREEVLQVYLLIKIRAPTSHILLISGVTRKLFQQGSRIR
jgi:hypothetical protein